MRTIEETLTDRTDDMRDSASDQRHRRALSLRLAGLSFQEIADAPGLEPGTTLYSSASSAWNAVKLAQKQNLLGDDIAEHRGTEMDRLDALQRAFWRQAVGGDIPAAKLVLAIIRERGKLLGLTNLPPVEVVNDPIDELQKRRDKKSG